MTITLIHRQGFKIIIIRASSLATPQGNKGDKVASKMPSKCIFWSFGPTVINFEENSA